MPKAQKIVKVCQKLIKYEKVWLKLKKVEERRERRGAWPPGGRDRFFWAVVQKSANFLFAVQKSANFFFAVQKNGGRV